MAVKKSSNPAGSPRKATARKSPSSVDTFGAPSNGRVSTDEIARRAYQLFIENGGSHGHDLDHWLMAERELLQSTAAE